MIRGIIFDLDGVIIDTEPLHFEAYQFALLPYGCDLTLEAYNQKLRSRGRHAGLVALLPEITALEIDNIGKVKDVHFDMLLRDKPEIFYPDALSLIEHCREKDIRIAVATASSKGSEVMKAYEMTHWFEHIVTSNDVAATKPDPAIYQLCKSRLGLMDKEILVIEDSDSGITSALGANLKVIHIQRDGAPVLAQQLALDRRVRSIKTLTDIIQ